MSDIPEDRNNLTFEQAEGIHPLPTQLQLREVSQELRAYLWAIVHHSIKKGSQYPSMGGSSYLTDNWEDILYTWHVRREHKFSEEFENNSNELIKHIKQIFVTGDYSTVFGFLEFVIRHPRCPHQFRETISQAMQRSYAAYTIQDKSIIPKGSEAEANAVTAAFKALQGGKFAGAREHLLNAGEALTGGSWAESVRESIHAVESIVMVLEPDTGSLAKALAKLERRKRIHPSLKVGFAALYGYTSDESGIRHPLIDSPVADVDETDALYMFGSRASFATYLVSKATAD